MYIRISCYQSMETFSKKLREIMSQKGVNQVELAKLSGVDQSLISRYLRMDKQAKYPSFDNLIKISQSLNCTLEELTGYKSLHNIEEKLDNPELSDRARKVAEFYDSLDENDPLKQMLEAYALQQNKKTEKLNDKQN